MIVAFEGLPAVGKTTTAQAIDAAFIVPEVPKLFQMPRSAPKDWYLDRQVARWEMGLRRRNDFEHVIFDGDPFQPLWFNWIYEYQGKWEDNDFVRAFYRDRIMEGRIAFPAVYVYFYVDSDELLRRRHQRDHDEGQEVIDRKFKIYSRMMQPLWNYFSTLSMAFPDRVKMLRSETIDGNIAAIKALSPPRSTGLDLEMLELLISFMKDYELEEPQE